MKVWRRFARRSQTPWLVLANWPVQPSPELIALAIGVTQRCSGCIGFHIKALHKLECTRAELEEMLSVCVYMGGGPALMYAAEAITAWEKMTPVKPG